MKAIFPFVHLTVILTASPLSAATLFVSTASPAPTPPFVTWATAAHSIQAAVEVAVSGDAVVVTNGTYGGSVVVAGKALALRSVNGPLVTTIDGGGTNRCAYLTNDCSLFGFTVTNGYADYAGGILCGFTNCFLTNCIIAGNSAGSGGGVEWGTLYDCLLHGNAAMGIGGYGGAASYSELYNCTVVANLSKDGALYECTAMNCIVYDNNAPSNPNYSGGYINYCCTTPTPSFSVGNLTSAPLFVNEAGGDFRLQAGSPCIDAGYSDYPYAPTDLDGNPRRSGAALDVGAYEYQSSGLPVITQQPTNQTVTAGSSVTMTTRATGATPMEWTWLFNGLPFAGGANPSLTLTAVQTNQTGPYSAVISNVFGMVTSQVAVLTVTLPPGTPPLITPQPTNQAVYLGADAIFSAGVSGSAPFNWQWRLNGDAIPGATDARLILTGVTPQQAGIYSVVVSNLYGVALSDGASLTVLPRNTISSPRFVWQDSPNPLPPFTNWASAAHTIQDAVDAAVPGDLVLVTNGIYATGSRQTDGYIDTRVVVPIVAELRSVNGPQFTTIDGGGTNLCLSMINGATLNGFTLTNGSGGYGGGAICSSLRYPGDGNTANLTNCVLAGNKAYFTGGGAVHCTLYDCTLAGNWGETNGGAASSCTLYRCTLTRNSGQRGAAAFDSTLYNCVISGNVNAGVEVCNLTNCTVAGNQAGGALESRLYNCIVYYNSNSLGWWGPNYSSGFLSSVDYSCTTPMPTSGVGNITNAPLFLDLAAGNFHLQPNSPCINVGDNSSVVGATDLAGNPRIIDGTVDLGAYEFQGAGLPAFHVWLQSYGLPIDGSADFVDSDGDGLSNWQEWICGTDPTNARSALRLLSATPTGTNTLVSWQSIAGVNYLLGRSLDVQTGFKIGATNYTVVATNILGQIGTTTFVDTNSVGAGPFFYRLGVQSQ